MDRERERARRLEAQDQEREALLRQEERLKQEEIKQQLAKKMAGEQLVRETASSNATQITLKKQAADMDKDEDRRIQAYIRAREKREQEVAQEQERTKAERERETARLRAQQEKMKDKQAELDALRARRATEDAERAWREKERNMVTKQFLMNATLVQSREAQKLEKERRLIEQAQQEKEEFQRILRVQSEADVEDKKQNLAQTSSLKWHQDELRAQIKMNAELRKKTRLDFLGEGQDIRANIEADRLRLEAIKAEKLAALHRAGVPHKYTVDLQHKQF